MNNSLKKNLTFNHGTGKINFKYTKVEDLIILPTFENLRIIGKMNRYFIFHMIGNTRCKKIFGKNFLHVKDGINSKLFVCNDHGDNAMLMIDLYLGLFEYTMTVLLIICFFEWIVKILLLLIILKICLSIKK